MHVGVVRVARVNVELVAVYIYIFLKYTPLLHNGSSLHITIIYMVAWRVAIDILLYSRSIRTNLLRPPVYSEYMYSRTLLWYRSRVHAVRLYYVYMAFS